MIEWHEDGHYLVRTAIKETDVENAALLWLYTGRKGTTYHVDSCQCHRCLWANKVRNGAIDIGFDEWKKTR